MRAANGSSGFYFCGTKGAGELWCWGNPIAGIRTAFSASPTRIGTRDDFVEVGLGDTAACGIVADGSIHCWGLGIDGLVGNGGTTEVPEPVAITSGLRFERLTVGDAVGCGLTDASTLHCWGASRLWDPTSTSAPAPVQVGDRDDWVDVAAAGGGLCAVLRSGEVQCLGQLSPRTRQILGFETMPAPEPTVAIARGGFVTVCGLGVSGAVHCQGANQHGQLGLRTRGDRAEPTPVATTDTFGRLTGGGFETCGLTPAGELRCWGELQAEDGMLTATSAQVPTPFAAGRTFDFLWAHQEIRFGIDPSGALFVFGRGRPTTGLTGAPDWTQVGDMTGWTSVAAHRDSHACGIRAGELWCWGPGSGSIGSPGPSEIDTPRRIGTDADWIAVAVEDGRTCGIRTGGALYCFGTALVEIAPGTAFQRIVLIEDKACGIADGSLMCWGSNLTEELVPGGPRTVDVPTPVDSHTDWTDVAMTGLGTCGIRAGEIHCWGQSTRALVEPTAPSRYAGIERIGTDADWESIMGSERHWCAVRRDGTAYCWGASDHGAVGNGEVWRDELTAVAP